VQLGPTGKCIYDIKQRNLMFLRTQPSSDDAIRKIFITILLYKVCNLLKRGCWWIYTTK